MAEDFGDAHDGDFGIVSEDFDVSALLERSGQSSGVHVSAGFAGRKQKRDGRHAAGERSVAGGQWQRQRRARLRTLGVLGQVQLLLFVLELVEAVVDAALGKELLMRALFAKAALVEDKDAVGVLNGAETMRDDESGAAAKQAIEGVADQQLSLCVHAGRGFVENKEARIVREGASEIDELALADGQRRAAFVDAGADAFRKRFDEIGEADFADGGLDGSAVDARSAQAHVGFDSAGEEKRILQHDAELAAQILEIDFTDVDAVKQDLAALNVVKAKEKRD